MLFGVMASVRVCETYPAGAATTAPGHQAEQHALEVAFERAVWMRSGQRRFATRLAKLPRDGMQIGALFATATRSKRQQGFVALLLVMAFGLGIVTALVLRRALLRRAINFPVTFQARTLPTHNCVRASVGNAFCSA